jgi:glycosyltransferase involved in cell wall biosynthesis
MSHIDQPHVCFVALDTWPVLSADRSVESVGGAQVQQSLLAKTLASRGFRVSMICFDYGQPAQVSVDGVTVYKCHKPNDGLPLLRFFHPRLTTLWSALRRADADIYYQRAAAAVTGITAAFARCHDRQFVYAAAHDLDLDRGRTWELFRRRAGWRDRQLFQLGLRLANVVIAQNPGQLRDYERCHGRSATLVPSCYADPKTRHGVAKDRVLWVSTLRQWKRPELFLELAKSLPHLRFRMVGGPALGEEPLFARISGMARNISNLEFVGFVPFSEIDEHFDTARVFVNTSVYEGFPNTFLQSWSRGIPTVSFYNTSSQINGQEVVTVANDLGEMVNLVDKLMQDDLSWTDASGRVRDCYAAFHTPDAAIEAYRQVFKRQCNAMPGMNAGSSVFRDPATTPTVRMDEALMGRKGPIA